MRLVSRSPMRRRKSQSKSASAPPRGRFARSHSVAVAVRAGAKRALTPPPRYEIAGLDLSKFPLGARPPPGVSRSSGASSSANVVGSSVAIAKQKAMPSTSAKRFRKATTVATKPTHPPGEVIGLPHDMRPRGPAEKVSSQSSSSEELYPDDRVATQARIKLLAREERDERDAASRCTSVDSADKGSNHSSDDSGVPVPPVWAHDKDEDGCCFLCWKDYQKNVDIDKDCQCERCELYVCKKHFCAWAVHEGTQGDRSVCGWCFYKGNPPALSAIADAGLNLPPPVPVPLQHPVPRGDTAVQRKHAKQHGKEYTSNTPKGKFKFGLSLVETAGVLVIAYVVMRNLGNLLALCLVFYERWMLILSMASTC